MPLLLRDYAVTTREISHFTLFHTCCGKSCGLLELTHLSHTIHGQPFGLDSASSCVAAMATHPSQMPQPGGNYVTPQDKGKWGVPTREGIQNLFDPDTYRCVPAPKAKVENMERHTTRENSKIFFSPETYRKPSVCTTPPVQKRPSTSPPSGEHPAKRSMGVNELVDKFKLAAQLNGVRWEDLLDLWC